MPKAKDQKPFTLSDTLRDLALLKASDMNLADLVPATSTDSTTTHVEENEDVKESLKNSYEYVRSARTVMKINDRGDVDVQGQRIENIREKLSNAEEGLADV